MRILHVAHRMPPASIGGVEVHVATIARAQREAGHDVLAFARGPSSDGPVQVVGFSPDRRPGNSFLERTRFVEAEDVFAALQSRWRPDVVHVHHLSGLSAGILAVAKAGGARVVFTIHDHAVACPRGQRIREDLSTCPTIDRTRCDACVRPAWIEAVRGERRIAALLRLVRGGEGLRLFAVRDQRLFEALDHVDVFVAPSVSAAELFAGHYGAARDRTRVVPHGILAPPRVPQRPKDGRFVVGYFGAVTPSKGVLVLARAVAALAGRRVAALVFGDGQQDAVAAVAAAGSNVTVRGPYAHAAVSSLMAEVDAVAVPSLWPETFSLVVREAWACGRPVLASKIGALVEAAGRSGDRVGLVPPGDVDAWAAAIERLRTDDSWRAALLGPHAPEPFDDMLRALETCYMGRR